MLTFQTRPLKENNPGESCVKHGGKIKLLYMRLFCDKVTGIIGYYLHISRKYYETATDFIIWSKNCKIEFK